MFIYKITNTINEKSYIGKTTKSIESRFKQHMHNSKNGNTYLYKAIRKYGKDKFKIELIETVENDNNLLNDREIHWIKILNPEYNMTKGGEGGDTSNSPNFIESIKNRKSTKNMSYEEIYGIETAKKLRENRGEQNKNRDYSKFNYSQRGLSKIEYFGLEKAQEIETKRKKSYEKIAQKRKKEHKKKVEDIRNDFSKKKLSRKQYSELYNINPSTLKKYLKGL